MAGDCEKAKQEYEYHGLSDCTMVNMMQDGGPKACSYGCLGDGSCVQACPVVQIHIVNGVAVVDKEACKACGKCVAVCPKHLIEIVPYDQKHLVKCNSQDKGKAVMQACTAGVSDVRCVRKHVSLKLLQWKITLRTSTTRNVKTVVPVQ